MADNLLSTSITDAFAHFPDGPNTAVHSGEARPVFDGLPAVDQDWVTETVRQYDPRNLQSYPALAAELGVKQSVTYGLMALLHPGA